MNYSWSGTGAANSWFNGSTNLKSNLDNPNLRHLEDQNGNSFQGPHAYYVHSSAKKEDVSPGISTIDMVLIRGHILGNHDIGSHKEVGGDINESATLTAFDLILMRKLILRFQNLGTSESNYYWRFIPTERLFNKSFHDDFRDDPFNMSGDPSLPSNQDPILYPNYYEFSYGTNYGPYDASAFPCRHSFSGIKPGDSNNSHPHINNAPAFWEVLNSCRDAVDLATSDPDGDGYVEDHFAGFEVFHPSLPTLPISTVSYSCYDLEVTTSEDIDDLIAFQTSWTVPDGMELQNLKFNGQNLGITEYNYNTNENELNLAWIEEQGNPVDISSSSPLFNIEFCVHDQTNGSISDNSNFLNEFVAEETSTTNLINFNYSLNAISPPISIQEEDQVAITIFVEQSGEYKVTTYNSLGQILTNEMFYFYHGLNKINNSSYNSGISFISVEGADYQATKKLNR